MTLKRIVSILLLTLVCMGVLQMSLRAQEPAPTPTVEVISTPEATAEPPPTEVLPPTTETPSDILGLVLASLFAGSATIAGSVFVTAVVSVLKLFIPSSVASGDLIKNAVAVVTWIIYSLAIRFGVGAEFQGIATFIAPILVTATPLIGVLIGSSKLYLAAKSANVPIVGRART